MGPWCVVMVVFEMGGTVSMYLCCPSCSPVHEGQ